MVAAGAYFGHLQAAGRAELTVRSYGMDLLRWFRFLWAAGVAWDRATRSEARDFCRWLQLAGKPVRPHWRERDGRESERRSWLLARCMRRRCARIARRCCAAFMTSTWRRARARWSIRSRWTGRGGAGRAHAHHNPMEPFRRERSGLYRPAVPSRIPRSVPDEEFNEIFAALHSHRDRALVAFYVSTGARASELLSATRGGVDPGRQLITVVRKGTRELQQLPASTDAFVWLRLYQLEMDGELPRGQRAAVVVDAAAAVPAAGLSRGAPHVRAGRRGGGHGRDAAFAAAYRGLPDGRGSGSSADRRAAGPGPCAADHHAAVSDAAQGGRDPPDTGPPRRAGPPGPAAGPAGSGAGLPARETWMCCSGTRTS